MQWEGVWGLWERWEGWGGEGTYSTTVRSHRLPDRGGLGELRRRRRVQCELVVELHARLVLRLGPVRGVAWVDPLQPLGHWLEALRLPPQVALLLAALSLTTNKPRSPASRAGVFCQPLECAIRDESRVHSAVRRYSWFLVLSSRELNVGLETWLL